MSLLQVAFTLHDLNKGDVNEYGFQVEFDLSRTPLTDSVIFVLKVISRLLYILFDLTKEVELNTLKGFIYLLCLLTMICVPL